jgi:hypothetical protein
LTNIRQPKRVKSRGLFCLEEAELLEVSKRVEQLSDQVLLQVVGRVHAHHKRRPEEGRRPDEPDDTHKKGEPHTTNTMRARLSSHQNKSIRRGGGRDRERNTTALKEKEKRTCCSAQAEERRAQQRPSLASRQADSGGRRRPGRQPERQPKDSRGRRRRHRAGRPQRGRRAAKGSAARQAWPFAAAAAVETTGRGRRQ